MSGRGRLEIGTYGDISTTRTGNGTIRAEARYRDGDGIVRKVTGALALGRRRRHHGERCRAPVAADVTREPLWTRGCERVTLPAAGRDCPPSRSLQLASSDSPWHVVHPGTAENPWFATERVRTEQSIHVGGDLRGDLLVPILPAVRLSAEAAPVVR